MPFFGDDNKYAASAKQLDILSNVMANEVTFYNMSPTDDLLSNHNTKKVWYLSEIGKQYLVFSANGSPFTVQLRTGNYNNENSMDAKAGENKIIDPIKVIETNTVSFTPPNTLTDWVLIIKND